eukprot:403356916
MKNLDQKQEAEVINEFSMDSDFVKARATFKRQHGFQWPLNISQIISWVFFMLKTSYFYIVIVTVTQQKDHYEQNEGKINGSETAKTQNGQSHITNTIIAIYAMISVGQKQKLKNAWTIPEITKIQLKASQQGKLKEKYDLLNILEQLESILSVFLDKFSGSISSNILHSKGEITEQEFDQWLYRTNPKNIRKNKSRVIIELDEESQKLSTRQKNKHNFQNQDLGDQIVVGGGEGGQINGPGDQQYQIDIGQELQQSQQEKVGQLLGEQAIIIEHQNINEPGNYQVDISKSLHLKSTVLNLEHQDYQHFKNKKNIKFYQKCKVLGWCCLNKQRKKVQDLMLQESQRNEEFNQDPNIHIQNLIINHKISNNNVFMNQKDQFEKSSNLTPSQVYDDQYYASNLNKNQQTIIHSHYQNSLNKQDKTRDFLKHGEQIHEIIDTQINALKTNGQLQANDKSPRTLLQTKNHVLESNHSFKNNAFQILKEMELNNLQDTFENTKSRQNE